MTDSPAVGLSTTSTLGLATHYIAMACRAQPDGMDGQHASLWDVLNVLDRNGRHRDPDVMPWLVMPHSKIWNPARQVLLFDDLAREPVRQGDSELHARTPMTAFPRGTKRLD